MTTTTGKHLKPVYYGYKGGFAKVTVCKDCGNTGLYEDQHPVSPCNNCGGMPIQNFTAAFDGNKWSDLKVFKEENMYLYYQGSIESIIEKSKNAAAFKSKSIQKKTDGNTASYKKTSVLANFFPSLF